MLVKLILDYDMSFRSKPCPIFALFSLMDVKEKVYIFGSCRFFWLM
jgi:hypothetical protein